MATEPTIRKAPPSRRRNSTTTTSAMSTFCNFFACPSRSILAMTLLIACCLNYSHGYNIDLPTYTRHTREPNTMFGFSIALHKGRDGFPQANSLVVGAPKYDTSSYQQGVIEAGAVFRCGMDDGDCSLVRFDSSGNRRNTYGEVIERKSFQWLGATVSTSRDNDLIVACAPRFVFHTMTPTRTLRYDPVGTCFTSRNFTQFNEISPCRTSFWGYHRQGSCQAGFSAAASKNGDRLYIGAPGSWYWQGEAFSISPDATFPYKPPFYQPFGTGGQSYSYDVTRPENQVFSTGESGSLDDDSYLGYSMATGDFNGDGLDDIAVGMPRGAGLLGKIVVNGWNMANIFNITGRQIGEYFGYALATSDVDGDGLDDLIIGAPMFSEPGNAEGKYDVGRVYILLQKSKNEAYRWTTEHIRDGYRTKGRFGLSLTSLGDVNRDGYGDFAVGAPYDGDEGRGAVYIFHGSANGPLQKPSQIIMAEDLVEGAPYPRTFGFSLSGGLDMDGNTYPDLAVGAYASDQVFIFKSRPVAGVTATTSFSNPSKLINLEEKNCQTVRDGKRVACTDITTCWSYQGEFLPKFLNFDVSWVLDAKKPKNPRMFFILDEGKNIRNQTITLEYGKTLCRNETVYLIDQLQDKLTPLEVETRYNLQSSRRDQPLVRRRRGALEPVIDQNREIIQRDAINIQKNCGLDNICEPDLRLEIQSVDKYLLGSRAPLTIEVLISNFNEDAFEAAFYMVMPKDLDFKKIQQIGDKGDVPITCTAPSEANNHTLKCDIGNPLQGGKVAKFNVVMLPSHKVGMAPSYDFFMEANSTNLEKPGSHFDNIIRKSIGIWVETDLSIEGTSLPDFLFYKASDYKNVENATHEEQLGPQVVHIYNIRNNGPSAVDEAVVLIHYPYQTAAGDLLMYMTNQPETDGNIRCDPHTAVNSHNLKLDNTLRDKSYLEQIGAVVRSSGSASASGYTGLHIEQSHGVSTGSGQVVSLGRGTHVLSAEEKRRLEKEDELDVSGDASFVHSERANAAAAAEGNIYTAGMGGAGGGSSGSWGYTHSWNSSSDGRGPSVIVSTKNSSVYYDASGQPHVVETSTQYVHNLDRPIDYYRQMQTSNYQNMGQGGQYGGQMGGQSGGQVVSQVGSQGGGSQIVYQGGSQGSGQMVFQGGNQGGGKVIYQASIPLGGQAIGPGGVQVAGQAGGQAVGQGGGQYGAQQSSQHFVQQATPQSGQQFVHQSAQWNGSAANQAGTTQSQQLPQKLPQQQRLHSVEGHNARGHIQMASPGSSSTYQQNYASYGIPGGSSGGAYRPHIQYTNNMETNTNTGKQTAGAGAAGASINELGGAMDFSKVAQGGHGFQAGTLDLGTLNRANVDNELRNRGAGVGGTQTYQQTYTSGAQGGAGGVAGAGTAGGVSGSQSYQQTYSTGPQVVGTYQQSFSTGPQVVSGSVGGGSSGSQSYQQSYASGPQVVGGTQHFQKSFSSGPQQGGGSAFQTSSYTSNGGAKPYYGMENEDYYDEESQQQPTPQQQQQQWSHSSSSSSSHRTRRQAASTESPLTTLSSPCKAAKCETLRCVATNLGKDDSVWIAIRTRMVATTMEQLASNVALNVSTMAVSYVTRLPFIGEPKDEIIRSHEIFFKAEPEPTPVPDVVPLWVVVLAACAGALILLLLIFLLYKCGFFKRNRPADHSQERQPLRNGYHGDEHL